MAAEPSKRPGLETTHKGRKVTPQAGCCPQIRGKQGTSCCQQSKLHKDASSAPVVTPFTCLGSLVVHLPQVISKYNKTFLNYESEKVSD